MYEMAKWTREQTTMLLELYKQYPHLYDNRNLCYSDRNERQNTLAIIAKELEKIRPKTTVRDLKQKIRTIRTQYCVEKHKFHKSQSKDLYLPRLWCYDSLKFLDSVTPYHSEYQIPALTCSIRKDDDDNIRSKHYSDYQELHTNETQQQDVSLLHATLSPNSQSQEPPIPCNLGGPVSPTIHLTQQLPVRNNKDKKSRNYAFAKFISEELDSIEDREILEDAKWDIQMAIRNALKQDRQKKSNECNGSFQSIENRLILSPSPSQSSSSACFQNGSIKRELSEEDV